MIRIQPGSPVHLVFDGTLPSTKDTAPKHPFDHIAVDAAGCIKIGVHKVPVRDRAGNGLGHPKFNPIVLNIPAQTFKALSPAMQQYWRVKAAHMDAIIIMKVSPC